MLTETRQDDWAMMPTSARTSHSNTSNRAKVVAQCLDRRPDISPWLASPQKSFRKWKPIDLVRVLLLLSDSLLELFLEFFAQSALAIDDSSRRSLRLDRPRLQSAGAAAFLVHRQKMETLLALRRFAARHSPFHQSLDLSCQCQSEGAY